VNTNPAPQLLAGKVALVTGSTRGIGRGIAGTLGSAGAKIIVSGRQDNAVQAVCEELNASGIEAWGANCDIRSTEEVASLVERALERFGTIDVICQNAGIYPEAPIREMTREQWDEVIETNLTGTYNIVHACAPTLQDNRSGSIVLISSITGTLVGYPGHTHYAATKASLIGFMRAAALEFAPFGVRVNSVAPGSIETEGLAELGLSDLAGYAIPLKRLGTPEDIGWATAFLASDLASFVTGHTFVVDGGQVIPEVLGRPQ
jgi:3-oxoacyl-[acyl-carrier protein] reductase